MSLRPPEHQMVPMRDGVRLHTRIWLPSAAGPHPAVLHRGYTSGLDEDAVRFARSGYVYVGQATRGHEDSEGENHRFFPDAEDGYDCLDWVAAQPWSNGDIAMYGKSYMAATQWRVAPTRHPNLKAIVPQNMNADMWERTYWCHGALTLAMTARGRALDVESARRYGWDRVFWHLPLIDLDVEVTGMKNRLWREYIRHSTYDDYWREISIQDGYDRIDIPTYLMAGWYDYYAGSAFDSYHALVRRRANRETRVIISATDHKNRVVGDRPLDGGGKDEIAIAVRWLDSVLKGIDTGIAQEPPIRIFVMGTNEWRYESEWPLARTRFVPYYFHRGSSRREGGLSPHPPPASRPSRYRYDPRNPVPTLGGNHSFTVLDAPEIIQAGPVDQRPNEEREDVLVFRSEPLAEALEVTGPISIRLFAESTALDTDFTAKLLDVYPDGTAFNLTEGVIRARFRDGLYDPPRLLEPGERVAYSLELLPTSNVFRPGHRVAVHITSSNFPLWDRNPNTGHPQGLDRELRVAEQTIFHDPKCPSHILLPVIPAATYSCAGP